MRQPAQGFDVQLLDALARHAQVLADGGEGLGWRIGQAIVRHDDRAQAFRELRHQTAHRRRHQLTPNGALGFGHGLRRLVTQHLAREGLRGSDRLPDRPADGRHRIAAERHAALRIVTLDRPPQRQPPRLHGGDIAQLAQPLLVHHPMHQPLMFDQRLVHIQRLANAAKCGILAHGDSSSSAGSQPGCVNSTNLRNRPFDKKVQGSPSIW